MLALLHVTHPGQAIASHLYNDPADVRQKYQFVFSVSCVDDPLTLDVDESLYCPLSSIIWDIDEEETTSQAKVQIFVAHAGAAQVRGGKIR